MKTRHPKAFSNLLTLGAAAFVALSIVPTVARADAERREERREERQERREEAAWYAIEIEPHFTFGAENVYGATGFGGGLRLSIPLVAGHLGRIPDNLALSFGGDLLHYDNCYYSTNCGANYLLAPVAAQWNVFVARRVSLFVEGGAFAYKGWLHACGPLDGPGCNAPSDFGILPTVAIGGRIHIGDSAALTLRVGYPMTTFGVSFL